MTNAAINMSLISTDDSTDLESMLNDMNDILGIEDEILDAGDEEEETQDNQAIGLISEFELEAAVEGAKRTEATLEAYAEQGEGITVIGEMNLEVAGELIKPKKDKAVRTARTPPAISVSGKIMSKTGGDAGVFILEPADAELTGVDLEAHVKALVDGADSLPVKAGNKMQLLFGYLKNGGKLNEYLLRAFEVLARDGEIKTGDAGNYIQAMTKPEAGRKAFGLGTARSQVSQLGALLPYLKVATKESGRFVLNPDSVVFAAVKANLTA